MRSPTTFAWLRPPADHWVDRPEMEAQQCVELTGTNRPRASPQHQDSRIHYVTLSKQPPAPTLYWGLAGVECSVWVPITSTQLSCVGIVMSVAIASGKRPVPFRTRKLSLTAPMVLHSLGCGRVGHRRHFLDQRIPPDNVWGYPLFWRPGVMPAPGTGSYARLRPPEVAEGCGT